MSTLLNEIVARYLKAIGHPREVVSYPEARYFGGRVAEKGTTPARLRSVFVMDTNEAGLTIPFGANPQFTNGKRRSP